MAYTDYFDEVQSIYIAYYQRPADPAGLRYWAQRLNAEGGNLDAIIDAFSNSPEAKSLYTETDPLKLVDSVYQALFGRPADNGADNFYVKALEAGKFPDGRPATLGRVAIDVLNGAQGDDRVAIDNKLKVANDFTQIVDGRPLTDPQFGFDGLAVTYKGDADAAAAREFLKGVTSDPSTVPTQDGVKEVVAEKIADPTDAPVETGKTFTLTDGIDNIVGNAADNTISAPVVQNQNGELVNSLETGDVINGGAGTDTLNAVLTNSQGTDDNGNAPAISTTLSGIEVVNYRAQFTDNDDNINGSHIDAELHAGVQQYWSDNSRADLQIEDVRQLPEELTFGMRQTDPGVSYLVYFDPAQLAADRGTAGDSSLTLTLVDNSAGANELENFPVNGVVFSLGGTQYTVSTEGPLGATYAEFAANLQTALKAIPALANIIVTLNSNNTITLTDPAGATFEAGGYTWVGNVVPSGGELQWNQSVGAAVISEAPITTNVVLDAVGRTSQGGWLDIGSMADGGVQVFNVSVDRSSWLARMESRESFGDGDRHLETVNLTSIGANGNLAIGDAVVGETGELDGRVIDGLTDVREVRNVAFAGELRYGVSLTNDSIGRYLDVASGEVVFTYEGGAGNDNITIADDSTRGALSRDPDFAMNVALGAGDDRLNLDVPNVANVTVDGGTGANVIAVANSHGTTAANTFEGFTGFQTYEVEGTNRFVQDDTTHDFTSMAGVTTVIIATDGDADADGDGDLDDDSPGDSTTLRNLAADAAVVISGKNQTLAGANASNADQEFDVIAINGADATATDTTLRVTLQNTARLNGVLTVNQLSLGDLPGDANPIRTLELVSAGQRNTRNVVNDINAPLVNTFNLSGTQDLTATITAAANFTAIAANRASLEVNGTALTGDLDLTLAGDLVTDVDAGTNSTVTLRGTAGANDILRLEGELTTTNDTTIAGFETVQFTGGASGTFDASNVSGVTLFDINDMTDVDPNNPLSLIDMQGNARINVNIDDAANVAGHALVFDAAAQATTNTLNLEFRDADADADNATNIPFAGGSISVRDYRTIILDLGGRDNVNEDYSFTLRMQDAEGDDETAAVAPSAADDAPNAYDAASAYARTVTVVGGGDQGAAGSDGGVDSVDLGTLTNVISTVDVSGYTGRVTLNIQAYEDAVVDRNVTIKLNGYGAELTEGIQGVTDGTIVTYVFTTDAVAASEDVVITGFNGFNDAAGVIDLTNLSVLDLSALGVNGLADLTIVAADFDGDNNVDGVRITSNEGLNFQIDLVGVALADLSNENFKFAA